LKGDEYHKRRMSAATCLAGLTYEGGLARALDDMISQTPHINTEIYTPVIERDCTNNHCFVTQHLPALVSAAEAQAQLELSGSVHALEPEDILIKRCYVVTDTLSRLEVIGRIFDKANAMSLSRTEARDKVKSKFDLYRVASKDVQAVTALTHFQTEVTSKLLIQYAPFLAKIYLSLLAHQPSCAKMLQELTTQPQDYQSQTRELLDLVEQAELSVVYNLENRVLGGDRSLRPKAEMKEEAEEILNKQIEVIKNYSMLQFIRLGIMHIPALTFGVNEPNKSMEEIRALFEEMSNISNATISIICKVASNHLNRFYGTPSTEWTLMLGGANARREFPSFDYDALMVYKNDGMTQPPDKAMKQSSFFEEPITHKEYFAHLFRLIRMITNDVGHHFDYSIQNSLLGQSLGTVEVPTLEEFALKIRDTRMVHIRTPLSTLVNVAGSDGLAQEIRNACISVLSDTETQIDHLAYRLNDRSFRRSSYRSKSNVKQSSGGLVDINEALWIYYTASGQFSNDVITGINMLPLATKKRNQLIEGYKFLIQTRMSLDFFYGRNDKTLPVGKELAQFVRARGYSSVAAFRRQYARQKGLVRRITDQAIETIIKDFPQARDPGRQLKFDQFCQDLAEQRMDVERDHLEAKKREVAREFTMAGSNFPEAWASRWATETGQDQDL
jgi:hypothetical protein